MSPDYNTCSMDDVIRHSILQHPTTLADALRTVQRTHRAAAISFGPHQTEGKRIALEMEIAASDCANDVLMRGSFPLANGYWSLSQRIIAFAAASRLQCLSPAVQQYIVAREG